MNKLEDLQDKFFLDIQNIIQELSEIDSIESLLSSDYLVKELAEKAAFLKHSQYLKLDQNNFVPMETNVSSVTENEVVEEEDMSLDLEDNQILAEAVQEELVEESPEYVEVVEEDELSLELSDNEMFKDESAETEIKNVEVQSEEQTVYNTEVQTQYLDEIASTVEEAQVPESNLTDNKEEVATEQLIEEVKEENPLDLIENNEAFEEQKESSFSFAFAKKEEEVNPVEETPETIASNEVDNIEVNQEEIVKEAEDLPIIEEVIEEKNQANVFEDSRYLEEKNLDKKFRIANIKGVTKSLFDLDSTDGEKEEETNTDDKGSLVKGNVATNYMEAPKPKPEFRLDLNDKIAFTQKLFNNSQVELNQAVNRLNSYQTLEAAKEYLSDLYYERNWQKADSYAQRLWTLVENRFL